MALPRHDTAMSSWSNILQFSRRRLLSALLCVFLMVLALWFPRLCFPVNMSPSCLLFDPDFIYVLRVDEMSSGAGRTPNLLLLTTRVERQEEVRPHRQLMSLTPGEQRTGWKERRTNSSRRKKKKNSTSRAAGRLGRCKGQLPVWEMFSNEIRKI